MRTLALLLLCACSGVDSSPHEETAPSTEPVEETTPASERAEEVLAEPAPPAAAQSESEESAPAEAESEANAPAEAESEVVDSPGENGIAPSAEGILPAPHVDASTEAGERIDRAGILRLTRALGLPAPLYVHGRPLSVPDSTRAVIMISFLIPGEIDEMHTEVWLLERAEGRLSRSSAAAVPHIPVPGYNEIAVGAEGLGRALSVKAQHIEDFDEDGELEYQLVVELIDEVVCGLGPLTHRYVLIYNLPTLSSALDIQTGERATATHFRSTILWEDRNEDGHPDVDLRVRNCVEWGDDEDGFACVRQQDTHVFYLWTEGEDRWIEAQEAEGRTPCAGGE